jgi:Ca2+-binding EF-hand superfamily protein
MLDCELTSFVRELGKALKLNGTRVTDAELKKLMHKYDHDNSGKLSFVVSCYQRSTIHHPF